MTSEEMKLNEMAAYIKGKPIYHCHQMIPGKEINCKPIDAEWKKCISKDKWWAIGYKGKLDKQCNNTLELRKACLNFGGEEVCLPYMDEDKEKIIIRGQIWYGDKITMMKGEDSQCHYNSALLWEVNKDKFRIATGYALSDDGMWRQHTWCIWLKPRQNRIIETTVKRELYYGFVMTEKECEEFLSHY